MRKAVIAAGLWGKNRSSVPDVLNLGCLLEYPNGDRFILVLFVYQPINSVIYKKRKGGIHFEMKPNNLSLKCATLERIL